MLGQRNASKVTKIAILIRTANIPLFASILNFPSHKRMKIIAENAAEATTTAFHHDCDANKPILPVKKPAVAIMQQMPAITPIDSFPKTFDSNHEPSGQSIPGWRIKNLRLCPAYNRCTSPCSSRKIPNNILSIYIIIAMKAEGGNEGGQRGIGHYFIF